MKLLLYMIYIILLSLSFVTFEKIVTIYARRSSHKVQKHWKFYQHLGLRDRSLIKERIKEITPKYCGLKLTTNNYIVGGVEAEKNKYPFIVAIRNDYFGQTCSGTIITDRWILTAAHCVGSDYTHNSWGFIAGSHEYSMGEKYYITQIIEHKKFNANKDENESGVFGVNDIALVKTDRKIRFNSAVNAICLPTIQDSESFGVITVVGWGVVKMKNKVGEDEESSPVLRKADLNIISDQKCANMYSNDGIQIIRSFLCVKHQRSSICQGESGGPGFQYINGRAVIVGIASWIHDDHCTPGEINVFTQVSYFLDWILLAID